MGLFAKIGSSLGLIRSPQTAQSVPVGVGGLWPVSGGMLGWSDGDTNTGTWQRGLSRGAYSPSVLMFSAVYACVSIISGDVAKIRIGVWKKDAKDGLVEQTTYPLARILRVPNSYQTRIDFWQMWMVSTLLTGNAYIYVVLDGAQRPMEWHVLDPRRVRPLVSEDGDVFYELETDKLAGIDEPIRIPARYVIHHRLMTVGHPLIGVTPLYAAALSASMGTKILESANKFFRNQGRPSGMLTAPGKISKETAITLQRYWNEHYAGDNSGKIAVAGDGLEFKAITLNAVDSQLIEQLRFSINDVARCFRVPGFMLGDLDKVSYKNTETLARAYYSGCLQYHFEAIENRLDTFFGLPVDMETKFNLDDLLRTDMDVRFNSYRTALQSSFMTINEVREREDLPRVEGGDEPLVQMQYGPLSAAMNKPDPAAPAPTPPPPDDPAADPTDDPTDDPNDPTDDPTDDGEDKDIEHFIARLAA